MPANQRVGLYDDQGGFTIKQPRPQNQRQPRCIGQWLGLQFVFLIEGQLLTKKQIFSNERGTRPGVAIRNRASSQTTSKLVYERVQEPHDSGIVAEARSQWELETTLRRASKNFAFSESCTCRTIFAHHSGSNLQKPLRKSLPMALVPSLHSRSYHRGNHQL